ncbi:MAG: hypothetical protein LH702_27425 [Phormidesmis sp. CAN_BIN44]|nr:hypothetical protein [Phormidesmis sp. CAN_BIN44]
MASQKRNFDGMSYREVQRANSNNRSRLQKEDQKWLKDNSHKNVGWNSVITLHQKIKEFLDRDSLEDTTLEDLYLEADRIGNKYLDRHEIEEFNRAFSKELNEIAEEIDKQFPDTEIEAVDFRDKTDKKPRKSRSQTSYKTTKYS